MQPTWLVVLSWVTVSVGLASAAVIVVDSFVAGYRQPFKATEVIWPVTGLYFGPVALIAYKKLGRPQSPQWRERYGNPSEGLRRGTVVIELYGRSAHCALGTIIATVTVFAVGLSVAGDRSLPEYVGDYLGAVIVSVASRYFVEKEKGNRGAGAAIATYLSADLLGVSVFEFALLTWLGLVNHFIFPEALRLSSPVFWFIVQIGLIIGLLSGWPIISWQAHRGRLR